MPGWYELPAEQFALQEIAAISDVTYVTVSVHAGQLACAVTVANND